MARLQDIQHACSASGYRKWAVVELQDYKHRPIGRYCRECGRRKHLKLSREEKEKGLK